MSTSPVVKVEDRLKEVRYGDEWEKGSGYIPTDFALEFVNFIKLVNGKEGEENLTPTMHFRMLDKLVTGQGNIANLCARGVSKTTLLGQYLFLYLATYGEIPGWGEVDYALYVGDSIENNVKKMRLRLERSWMNSKFLQHYVPESRFTDIRWYFKNREGKEFVVTGHGASTGVRGTVELNTRPKLAVLDDLISDEDSRSATIISSVEDTVYKAIDYALHPKKNRIIWSGTPFNARDPLYKAVESGAWDVNIFPVCETFPCSPEEFRSCWPDRFTYEYVQDKYSKALKVGRIDTFNQELMLRIISDEDRLIEDQDIIWYPGRSKVIENKSGYNWYITTDFATKEADRNDYSVISVWAHNNNGDWLWVDGIMQRQLMDKNIDDLFRLVQTYSPLSVGVEVTGQQQGFVTWIQKEMMERNIFFNLASDKNSKEAGIRPVTSKLQRFNVVVPWFKAKKVWFPLELRESPILVEAREELKLATPGGLKSRHDDFLDTISQLSVLKAWRPSAPVPTVEGEDRDSLPDSGAIDRYLV